ncbi:hypothetical protein TRVL_08519 [Trypanosoma vivax]|nr:hypothetical protein TRVL_08519 [Trypanosoma vivax]
MFLPFRSKATEALAAAAVVITPVVEELLYQQSLRQAIDSPTNTMWLAQPWQPCKRFVVSHVPERLVTTGHHSVNHANLFRGCSLASRTNSLPPPVKTPWKHLTLFSMAHQRRLYFPLAVVPRFNFSHRVLKCFLKMLCRYAGTQC